MKQKELPYSVLYWSTDPSDDRNDGPCNGSDWATQEEALREFNLPASRYTAYVELTGPDIHRLRENPAYRPDRDDLDDEWRRERAMQAGMAFGCDGYNDEMGY